MKPYQWAKVDSQWRLAIIMLVSVSAGRVLAKVPPATESEPEKVDILSQGRDAEDFLVA